MLARVKASQLVERVKYATQVEQDFKSPGKIGLMESIVSGCQMFIFKPVFNCVFKYFKKTYQQIEGLYMLGHNIF